MDVCVNISGRKFCHISICVHILVSSKNLWAKKKKRGGSELDHLKGKKKKGENNVPMKRDKWGCEWITE